MGGRRPAVLAGGVLLALLALPPAAAGAGEAAGPAGPEAGARPPKIAVVDVRKAVHAYKRREVLNKETAARFEERARKLRADGKALTEARRRLEADPRGPRNTEVAKEAEGLTARENIYRIEAAKYQRELVAQELRATHALMEDLLAAAARYGEDNGLDLVIAKQEWGGEAPKSRAEFNSRLESVTTLYNSGRLDCTEGVIKLLNDRYERGKVTPLSEPPAERAAPAPEAGAE